MTSISDDAQTFGSQCYAFEPLIIIPSVGGFLVGYGYSGDRRFIAKMGGTELLNYLETKRPRRATIPVPKAPIDLDINLSDLEIDI